jgi:hypothetical protein
MHYENSEEKTTELLLQQRTQIGPKSPLFLLSSVSTGVSESVGNPVIPYYVLK